jgi:hypothetical protein
MLKLIGRETDFGAAANAAGPAHISYRTFMLTNSAMCERAETWLTEKGSWFHREIIGVEIVAEEARKDGI